MSESFDVATLALESVCPGNKFQFDDKGLPSAMVYIPKFKLSEVLTGGSDDYHPMFRINGQIVDGIWISKYQNVVESGRGYSLPGKDPKASITWDTARGYCEAKGTGWHMMTRAEYAGIALWCKQNGFFPKGNNNYGKDTTESNYKAIPATYGAGDDAGKIYHVLTGTGPLSWRHNNAPDGICDLNGNVSEWTGGIRTVYGELQLIPYNDSANGSADQSANSSAWRAIDATTGEFITPDGNGTTTNSIKVNCNSNAPQYDTTVTTTSSSFNAPITSITCASTISEAAKLVLRTYGLLAEDGAVASDYGDGDRLYFNNEAAERLFYSGGYYNNGANAGVFYSGGSNGSRSSTGTGFGFRAAFADLST